MQPSRALPVFAAVGAMSIYVGTTSLTPSDASTEAVFFSFPTINVVTACPACAAVGAVVGAGRGEGYQGKLVVAAATGACESFVENNDVDCAWVTEHAGEFLEYDSVPVLVRTPATPGTIDVIVHSIGRDHPLIIRFTDGAIGVVSAVGISGSQVQFDVWEFGPLGPTSMTRWETKALDDGSLRAALESDAGEMEVEKTAKDFLLVAPCVRINTSKWGTVFYRTDSDSVEGVDDPEAQRWLRTVAPYVKPSETVSVLGRYPDAHGDQYVLVQLSASPDGAGYAMASRLDAVHSSPDDPVYFVLEPQSGRFADLAVATDVLDHRSLREFTELVDGIPDLLTPETVAALGLLWGYESVTSLRGVVNMLLSSLSVDERAKLYLPALEQAVAADDADHIALPDEIQTALKAVKWGNSNPFELAAKSFLSNRMRATALIRWHPAKRDSLIAIVRNARKGEKLTRRLSGVLGTLDNANKLLNIFGKCQDGASGWNAAVGVDEELVAARKYMSDSTIVRAFELAHDKVNENKKDLASKLAACVGPAILEAGKDLAEWAVSTLLGSAGAVWGVVTAVESFVLNSGEVEPVAKAAFTAGHLANLLSKAAFDRLAPDLQDRDAVSVKTYRDFKALVHLSLLLESVAYSNTAGVYRSASKAPIMSVADKEKLVEQGTALVDPTVRAAEKFRRQAEQFAMPEVVVTASASGPQRQWATGVVSHEECLGPCDNPVLSGRILDAHGKPVPGGFASLWVGDRLVYEATADDETGAFGFCNVADGAYVLRAAAPGYCAQRKKVAVKEGKGPSTPVKFGLKKAGMPAKDFYTQVATGKLAVEATGGGARADSGTLVATVQLTNLSCEDLRVLIDAGTTFRNEDPHRQNMVVASDKHILLRSGERTKPFRLGGYCISRHKGSPSGAHFVPDPKLAKPEYNAVLEAARKLGLTRRDAGSIQHAIWFFSDNISLSPRDRVAAKLVKAATPERRPIFVTRVDPHGAAWSVVALLCFGLPLYGIALRWLRAIA